MTEETTPAVKNQEAGAPEVKTAETPTQQTETKQPEAGSKEYNFRQMERQLQEQKRQNQELIEALKGKIPQIQPEDESLPALSPDDIPEWKHVDKALKAIKKNAVMEAREEVKKEFAEQEKARLPEKVRGKYPDFDKVVTAERIEKLEKENPALAQAFAVAADPYSAAYSYLKVLYAPKIQDSQALEEAQKIAENAKKPVSSNAAGRQGALKNAAAFAKKPKDQLYKEMMDAASRAI